MPHSRGTNGDIGVTRGEIECGPVAYTILVFLCVALYNVMELTFIIWGYFKRHSGLYFWSFNIATYGIAVYALGFLFKATLPKSGTYAYVTLIGIGWVTMIIGQSLVLWSRLHLVLQDTFKLRIVLWIIIINSTCMFIPILVMLYGANSTSPERWVGVYSIYENIQVSMFVVQELILSLIYIWETVKLARLHSELRVAWRSRRLMIHLIVVNVVIILLDVGILGLEYSGLYGVQTSYKAFVYSVKLKMEFTILNRLKEMTTGQKGSSSDPTNSTSENTPEYLRRSTGTGTDLTGGIYPYSSPSWPRQPPPISYHAYVQGRNGCRELDRRSESEGNSTDNEVIMTRELMVRRDTLPSLSVAGGDSLAGPHPAAATESQDKGNQSKKSSDSVLPSRVS